MPGATTRNGRGKSPARVTDAFTAVDTSRLLSSTVTSRKLAPWRGDLPGQDTVSSPFLWAFLAVGSFVGTAYGQGQRAWVEASHGLRNGVAIQRIDISASGRLILIGDNAGFVYRSTDGGAVWDESRLIADDVAPLPIPLPVLGEVLLPLLGLTDAPAGAPPFPAVPEYRAYEGFVLGEILETEAATGGSSSGGLGPRNRSEDPGDIMSRYFSGTADQPSRINSLSICPTDERLVYAATNYGLFRSEDGGVTWLRVFAGVSDSENVVGTVACDPVDASRAYAGTPEGFFYSRDRGISWKRPLGPWGGLGTCSIGFDPADPQRIYLGTASGVVTSTDLDDFRFVYDPVTGTTEARTTCAPAPTRGSIFYVGSDDGGVVTRDDGHTWERLAPFTLERWSIRQVVVDPGAPEHAYFLTDQRLYETRDAGRTISEIYTSHVGAALRWLVLDPRDPDRVLLVTAQHLFLYEQQRGQPRSVGADPVAQSAARALLRDPSLGSVIDSVLGRLRLDGRTFAHLRSMAHVRRAMPQVALGAWLYRGSGDRTVRGPGPIGSVDSVYASSSCRLAVAPSNCWLFDAARDLRTADEGSQVSWGVGVVLTWNLPLLEFDRQESHPIWPDILGVRGELLDTLVEYWMERSRILRELTDVPHSAAATRALSYRVREVGSVLTELTGGQFGDLGNL